MPLASLLLGCPPAPVEIPPPVGPPLGSSEEWRKELARAMEAPEVVDRQHLRDMMEEVCPPSAGDLKWPRMSPATRQMVLAHGFGNPWGAAKLEAYPEERQKARGDP